MIPAHPRHGASGIFTRSQAALCAALFALVGTSTLCLLMAYGVQAPIGNDAERVAEIARSKMDSLHSLPYTRLTSGCDTLEAYFIRRWYVSTNLTAARKSVELLVSWPLTAGHTVAFNTYIADSRFKVRP